MIGNDGEGQSVDEMLQVSFKLDTTGLDEVSASSEIHNFIAALRPPHTHTHHVEIHCWTKTHAP